MGLGTGALKSQRCCGEVISIVGQNRAGALGCTPLATQVFFGQEVPCDLLEFSWRRTTASVAVQ